MLLVCPKCTTAYPIDPAGTASPAGQRLHCANCNASWVADGPMSPDIAAPADQVAAPAESAAAPNDETATAPVESAAAPGDAPAALPAESAPTPGDELAAAPVELVAAPGDEPVATPAEIIFTPFNVDAFNAPTIVDRPKPIELLDEIDFIVLPQALLKPHDIAFPAEAAAAQPFGMIEAAELAPPIEVAAPETENSDLDPDYIESYAARRRRLQARRNEKRRSADWTAVLVLIACTVTAVSARSDVVHYLPQSAKVFAAIGLPVNLRGLDFEDVSITKDAQDGGLTVQGALVSTADKPIAVPRLHFAARNATGQDLYVWTERPSRSILQPGEQMAFTSRLASPPAGASDVMVSFVR